MNEFYVEHLIKKNRTWKDWVIGIALLTVTTFSFLLVNIHILLSIIPLTFIVLTIIVFFNLNVEYEYFYMNGNLEIDRIASKRRRRRIFEMKIYDLDVIAPEGAHEIQPYRSVKKVDYSSRDKSQKRYEMIVTQGKRKRKLVLEPSELIVESMKKIEPRKVII